MLIEDVTENTPRDSAGRAKKYLCTFVGCGKRYAKPCLIEEHVRTHMSHRPFTCSECHKTFTRERNLSAHMVSHTVDRTFICSSCGKTFKTKQHLVQHEETHNPLYFCPYEDCKMGFRRKVEIRGHLRKVHLDGKPYACSIEGCGSSFKTKRQLTKHENTVHSEFPKYHCGEEGCSGQFHTFDELRTHLKCHRSQTQAARKRRRSFTETQVMSHSLSSGENSPQPESPVSSPEDDDNPLTGATKKHKKSIIDLLSGDRTSYVESRKIACVVPGCEFRFQRQYDLERHVAAVHRTIPESYQESTPPESVPKKPRFIDVPATAHGFEIVELE